MAQTYRNLEILLLDNDSSDRTTGIPEGVRRQEARLGLQRGGRRT